MRFLNWIVYAGNSNGKSSNKGKKSNIFIISLKPLASCVGYTLLKLKCCLLRFKPTNVLFPLLRRVVREGYFKLVCSLWCVGRCFLTFYFGLEIFFLDEGLEIFFIVVEKLVRSCLWNGTLFVHFWSWSRSRWYHWKIWLDNVSLHLLELYESSKHFKIRNTAKLDQKRTYTSEFITKESTPNP